jgi:hypothetical protein
MAMPNLRPLELKYAPLLPALMIVSGALIVWSTLVAGFLPSSILGIILPLLGFLMLTRPIALVHTDRIEQTNLIGKVMRTSLYSESAPSVHDGALYAGTHKIAQGWMINTKLSQIQAFLNALKLPSAAQSIQV